MFARIKKALSRGLRNDDKATVGPPSQPAAGAVSEWASTRGFDFTAGETSGTLGLEGKVGGRPWRMELGRPTRNLFCAEELRGRANSASTRMPPVLYRTVEDALDKRYSIFTDPLRTSADPALPEEMRWLSMDDEVGWAALPQAFWHRYPVLADRRENATAWVDSTLAAAMLDWPRPGPTAEPSCMLMLLRGNGYMRREYQPPDLSTLQHATLIFTTACENALGGLPTPAQSVLMPAAFTTGP